MTLQDWILIFLAAVFVVAWILDRLTNGRRRLDHSSMRPRAEPLRVEGQSGRPELGLSNLTQ